MRALLQQRFAHLKNKPVFAKTPDLLNLRTISQGGQT
jgi:hypothetical protein